MYMYEQQVCTTAVNGTCDCQKVDHYPVAVVAQVALGVFAGSALSISVALVSNR